MDKNLNEIETLEEGALSGHIWIPHLKWELAYQNWFMCTRCKREYHSKIIPSILPKDECNPK